MKFVFISNSNWPTSPWEMENKNLIGNPSQGNVKGDEFQKPSLSHSGIPIEPRNNLNLKDALRDKSDTMTKKNKLLS